VLAAWNIQFFYNNEPVMASGNVEIRLPTSASFTGNPATLAIWRVDGSTWEQVDVRVRDGFLVFESGSGHFSVAALALQDAESTLPAVTITPATTAPAMFAPGPGGQGTPPPHTGASLRNTSATIAVVVLTMGSAYSGWRFFKKEA